MNLNMAKVRKMGKAEASRIAKVLWAGGQSIRRKLLKPKAK